MTTNKKTTVTYPISMEKGDMKPERCAILYALDIIGQKWKLPILWYLHEEGTIRYNELKRKLDGITNMMLAKSLKELETADLIIRKQYPSIPPKVEYSLSNRGSDLLPALNELYKWGEKQQKLTLRK